MGKTLKRQRQRALREQQQQQQEEDGGPCKIPRISGMPILRPNSSCSKYTYAISAALHKSDWLAALQILEAMTACGKLPKLGAIQRWVRDADQAGCEAVTARLIDAICRSTMPPGAKSASPAPAATATAADVLKGSTKQHPPWRSPLAADAATAGPSSALAPPLQQQAGNQLAQPQQLEQLMDYANLFYQVPFAPGSGGPDAIHSYPPGTIQFDKWRPAVTSVQVPFVPGAQCLVGVLSKQECKQIMAAAEAIGYNANVDYTFAGGNGGDGAVEQQQQQHVISQQDLIGTETHQVCSNLQQSQQEQQSTGGPTPKLSSTPDPGGASAKAATSTSASKSAARGLAADLVGLPQGGPAAGCVWLVDDSVLQPVFDRVAHLLPQEQGGGQLAGLNARWRLYRYTPGNVYRPHIDGAWPGSGLDTDGKYLYDAFGDRWSRFTFLVYLNDDFEGGHTTFYTPSEEQVGCLDARGVPPVQGNVMVFPHGGTVGSLVHEGSAVLKGAKYVIRTDVLYMKAEPTGRRGQQVQPTKR